MSDKRFYKDHGIDGWPIIDGKTGRIYNSLNKNELINLLNDLAEKSDRATPVENGTNRYGLDVGYFRNAINRELNRSLSDYKPDELARVLARLSRTADPIVLSEPEFNGGNNCIKHSKLYKEACHLIGKLEDEVLQLRSKKLKRFNDDECWIFNPEECSHPKSLVCPVVMSADDFRTLLKQAGHWQVDGCNDCNEEVQSNG